MVDVVGCLRAVKGKTVVSCELCSYFPTHGHCHQHQGRGWWVSWGDDQDSCLSVYRGVHAAPCGLSTVFWPWSYTHSQASRLRLATYFTGPSAEGPCETPCSKPGVEKVLLKVIII